MKGAQSLLHSGVRRMLQLRLIPIASLFAILPGIAGAGEEGAYQVAFPLSTSGALAIGDMPQVLWGSAWDSPGLQVYGTTAEFYAKTDLGLENRNIANQMRIQIRPKMRPALGREEWHALFGDTLRVVLDLSKMASEARGWSAVYVLETTLDCMIINAARDAHKPRFLGIEIEGKTGYKQFEGTYRLEPTPILEGFALAEPGWEKRKIPSE
jgi:hypothetical protein